MNNLRSKILSATLLGNALGVLFGFSSCGPNTDFDRIKGLTDESFRGKKYYLGWGVADSSDPQMMHNEVRYDVQHTSDVFTKDLGGSYIGTSLIGGEARGSRIVEKWQEYKNTMTKEDMFIQYSSGHGLKSGLAIGLSWRDMTRHLLELPSKETIIFTMACYSGNFVDAMNAQKSTWQNRSEEGRTLFLMSSSRSSETSSTGPGVDKTQPGPNGSAGSAYGHALWKALSGLADGSVDGIKDGYLSLEEISVYTVKRTKELGGHTPVITGSYNPGLLMSRVPVKSQ